MKKVTGDQLTREKIESLDTLSGGIVFGKEEAWTKLQARMDKKPARKAPLQYWLAAAAVLLVMISAGAVYFYPQREVTKSKKVIPVKENISIVTIQQPGLPAIVQKAEIILPEENAAKPGKVYPAKTKVAENKKPAIEQETKKPAEENAIMKMAVSDSAMLNKQITPALTINNRMKVVQINELDAEDKEKDNQVILVGNMYLKNLAVVHINDVVREEYQAQQLRQENRLSIGRLMNPRGVYCGNSQPSDEYKPIHKFKYGIN